MQTLREWLNERITHIRQGIRAFQCEQCEQRNDKLICNVAAHKRNLEGRLAELSIIREKINDGRIQEIR